MAKKTNRRVSILIPEEVYQQLTKQAEHSARSLSSYIRQVLKWHLLHLNESLST